MSETLRVARKELAGFFASPVAYIFLGAFLLANLFVFFWVETFFARNLADARPLFAWMPVLLIFLTAALTMRMWSEERRAGTLEVLLTAPVAPLKLVLGKFLAALGLVAVALALTLPLPVTVSLLGPLDWGPVLGGYLASLLLAGAYIAIGLFVSARTDNPIVALIGTTLLGGAFYLLGSGALTGLFGHEGAALLKLLGSGSRFESITRGVIDLRDLYFYVSVIAAFLALNVYTLERLRWAGGSGPRARHRAYAFGIGLLIANVLAANLWLQQIGWLRADLTEGRAYSLSDATKNYLAQLREPLLIRGYFSAQTHPLLAPLVPQLRDLLREYEVAGGGRVRVELVDPLESPELEREAGEKYGIRPVAFQTASKYQAGVVNSYFDLLIQYGDQYEKLGFRELIEVKALGEGALDVRLRNPQYDLTRAIKKVLYGYQVGGNVLDSLTRPVRLTAFVSAPERLPEPLPGLAEDLGEVAAELAAGSGGRFEFAIQDPTAGDGRLAEEIAERYGFQPLVLGLLDPEPFYFYLLLESGDDALPVPLPEELDRAGLKRVIESGLKRFAPGLLRNLALYTPAQTPGLGPATASFDELKDALRQGHGLRETDLSTGRVPEDADLLLVIGPEAFDERQVFALDQFLMQGGTLILAASPYHVDLGGSAIAARRQATGLEDWLAHLGVGLEETLVLDPQNTPFPIPVQRQVGGFVVEEIQTLAYPYFPDIRPDGMDEETGIAAGLGQITLNWASPVALDEERNRDRRVVRLLQSSPAAWSDPSENVQPDFQTYPGLGFRPGDETGRRLLAVAVEGRFDSYFAGRPSPLAAPPEGGEQDDEDAEPETAPSEIAPIVEVSPPSARLILIGSASFLTDTAIALASEATRTLYTKPVELIQNAVDWSLEDRGLLVLRGQGQYSRLLAPLDRDAQLFWEYLNYALALLGLALVYWLHRRTRLRRVRHYAALLAGGTRP